LSVTVNWPPFCRMTVAVAVLSLRRLSSPVLIMNRMMVSGSVGVSGVALASW
jgi:hypothetical protein